jgi:hypothetical protein
MSLVLLVPPALIGVGLLWAVVLFRARIGHPALWLALLYFGSAVAALFVDPAVLQRNGLRIEDQDWLVLVGYSVCTLLFLLPAFFLRNRMVPRIKVDLVERAVKLSVPLILFSFLYMAPVALKATLLGAASVRSQLNNDGIGLLPVSPLTTLAVVTAQFYLLFAFAFVLLTVRGGKRWIRLVAFLGSTLYIVNALCFAARDGILWFLVAYLWALWITRPLMSPAAVTRIRRLVYPIAALGLLVFGLFSVQRFGDRHDASLTDYLVAYYGTQPYVFATTVASQTTFYEGHLRFPLVVGVLGGERHVQRTVAYEWSFGTFIKDFYSEGGWYPLVFSALLFPPALIVALLSTASSAPGAYVLLSMLYVQFMAQGVFYFRLGSRAGNLYIVAVICAASILVICRSARRGEV